MTKTVVASRRSSCLTASLVDTCARAKHTCVCHTPRVVPRHVLSYGGMTCVRLRPLYLLLVRGQHVVHLVHVGGRRQHRLLALHLLRVHDLRGGQLSQHAAEQFQLGLSCA